MQISSPGIQNPLRLVSSTYKNQTTPQFSGTAPLIFEVVSKRMLHPLFELYGGMTGMEFLTVIRQLTLREQAVIPKVLTPGVRICKEYVANPIHIEALHEAMGDFLGGIKLKGFRKLIVRLQKEGLVTTSGDMVQIAPVGQAVVIKNAQIIGEERAGLAPGYSEVLQALKDTLEGRRQLLQSADTHATSLGTIREREAIGPKIGFQYLEHNTALTIAGKTRLKLKHLLNKCATAFDGIQKAIKQTCAQLLSSAEQCLQFNGATVKDKGTVFRIGSELYYHAPNSEVITPFQGHPDFPAEFISTFV